MYNYHIHEYIYIKGQFSEVYFYINDDFGNLVLRAHQTTII